MKFIFTFLILLFISSGAFAQKIQLKKNTIIIDGIEAFSYDKISNATEFVVYELNTKNQLVSCVYYPDKGYRKIIFTQQKKSLETSTAYWGKSLIKLLLEQNVLSVDGKLNVRKIDLMIEKYDQNITN